MIIIGLAISISIGAFLISWILSGLQNITVFYTASLQGNLDGCDCKHIPRAGLVKRAYFLNNQKMVRDPILVDAGDIFEISAEPILSEFILESYKDLGYVAVAIGDLELALGIDKVVEWAKKYPLFSHNLLIRRFHSANTLSSQAIIVQRGTVKVAILSLIDEAVIAEKDMGTNQDYRIISPPVAAEAGIAEARARGAVLFIVLFHGRIASAEELASQVEDIDIIIVGHEGTLMDLKRVDKTVLVSPGEEGNWIGILKVSLQRGRIRKIENEFRAFSYKGDPDDPTIRERIEKYETDLRTILIE
jgi:2',3'-cyclic-nucleotide 2'-phosphodiesterase (5'-nucleotidase family)